MIHKEEIEPHSCVIDETHMTALIAAACLGFLSICKALPITFSTHLDIVPIYYFGDTCSECRGYLILIAM